MAEAQKVGLNDLEKWVENETADIVEPLREKAKKLLEENNFIVYPGGFSAKIEI